jgi:uncharacterized protein (TIGR03083 family)
MQLNPIYGDTPILQIEGLGDPSVAVRRQSLRLLDTLRELTDAQWAAQSRCELWSVKDVIAHLTSTNQFWAISFAAGMRGEPTTFLATFDPVASPERLVDGTRATPAAEILAKYEANVTAMLAALDAITDWSVPVEAPPGHLAANATALHALWDSWIHERDIAVPLGLPCVEDDEEMALILQYAAALSPAFYAAKNTGKTGTLVVEATDPDVTLAVEVGDQVRVLSGALGDGPLLRGPAVDLIEGLSHRAPLPDGIGPDDRWILVGLEEVFDKA